MQANYEPEYVKYIFKYLTSVLFNKVSVDCNYNLNAIIGDFIRVCNIINNKSD